MVRNTHKITNEKLETALIEAQKVLAEIKAARKEIHVSID